MSPVPMPDQSRNEFGDAANCTIAELFQRQAALTPDAIAVVDKNRELTYRELDQQSNRLARHLQSLGVTSEILVGVLVGRSVTLTVALLGILKAGGAYVPLDSSYPDERLSLVVKDSGMSVVLVSAQTRGRLHWIEGEVTTLELSDHAISRQSAEAVMAQTESNNLAYVIYTSGSTGKPKGVMVEHRNVVSFFAAMDLAIGREPGVWLAVTSIAFDISVLELLWTVTRGFKVVIHGEEGLATMADDIARFNITHLQMTPSLAHLLLSQVREKSALASLKRILLGGEALPVSLFHRLRSLFEGEVYNMYGPTETTVWSMTYPVRALGVTVPIGRPIANTQVYLLDADRMPVPAGEPGELFIGGEGVSRGYWNRPDLTAERFLTIPSISPGRIYRTGDLARMQPDGNVEFLGRSDFQVKIRGHRIELGEVEALLERCAGIRQAVVIVREDAEGDKRLVAYLVSDRPQNETVDSLRASLGLKLPAVMIPSAFVCLAQLPLTANGKIDRGQLLKLPLPLAASAPVDFKGEAASELELIVTESWQQALGISKIGLNDNFFDLGAHSLTVADVQAKLQNRLKREISILDLFEFSTVRSLSRHLSATQSSPHASDRSQRRRLARPS